MNNVSQKKTITALTISFTPTLFDETETHIREALNKVEQEIEHAALRAPDLICIPETFASVELPEKQFIESAQGLDGAIFSRISALAKKHRVFITCPMLLHDTDNKIYNSVLLLDRNGDIAARYDKSFPTIMEVDLGVVPGKGAVVTETEIGKVGFAICFDLNFSELREQYKKLKPELIIFCSMFHGGLLQNWYALDCRCHFISSFVLAGSRIINPLGETIAETNEYTSMAHTSINYESRVLHLDYNRDKFDDIRSKYGHRIHIEVPAHLGLALIQSCDSTKPIDNVIKEFDLELVDNYFDRSRKKLG